MSIRARFVDPDASRELFTDIYLAGLEYGVSVVLGVSAPSEWSEQESYRESEAAAREIVGKIRRNPLAMDFLDAAVARIIESRTVDIDRAVVAAEVLANGARP